jgi:hypothetical protein
MRVDNAGNVGIGVTPAATWSDRTVLQIGGNLTLLAKTAQAAGNQTVLAQNTSFDTSADWIYQSTDEASYYDQRNGSHYWFTAPSGTAGNDITFTERMRIDNAGNVTKPTNVYFSLSMTTGPTNVTGDGTAYTVVWDTELYDIGSNCSGGVFTAPVTGKYLLTTSVQLSGWSDQTYFTPSIFTSNRTYFGYHAGDVAEGGTNQSHPVTVIADMDAGDTATSRVSVGGGSKVIDINTSAVASWFHGTLLS